MSRGPVLAETARAVDAFRAATGEEFRKAAFDPGLWRKTRSPGSPRLTFSRAYLVSKVSTATAAAGGMFKEFRKNAARSGERLPPRGNGVVILPPVEKDPAT